MALSTCITRLRTCSRNGLALALVLGFTACGGGADTVPNEPPTNPPTNPPAGPTSGLPSRPANTTCLAPDRPTQGTTLTLSTARVFSNLSFSSPIAMMQAPGDSSRWFVVQQGGTVRVFPNTANPTAMNFVQLGAPLESGGEKGLLGMAFHPNFPTDARVFLSYTADVSSQLVSRISEFRSTDGGNTIALNTENILLTIDQPQDNHNGGHIAFGPDGNLYIGIGDGGGGGDPFGTIGNGQNKRTLLGKLLRIAVPATAGGVYTIPAGNPFASNPKCGPTSSNAADCPEIYAFGFRNPWRWNFDSLPGGSNELWLGDVGQGNWEEVDRVVVGGNYGWRCREGAHDFSASCGNEQPRIDPVAEYRNNEDGISITGGYVYRGSAIPALQGRYVFGDYGSGNIWHIARDTAPTLSLTAATAFASGRQISSFGQGNDGELYVVDYGGGLYRLNGTTTGGNNTIPTMLSATGCVSTSDAKQPASGLIPYAPNAPFWSDSAAKDRWIALPDNATITVQGSGDWDFPNRTVLMKNFRIGTRLIETRLFMRHPDGEWAGYTYEWNDAQTDATRVIGGKEAPKTGLTSDWIFPSESQCLTCHTAAAGRSLGIETAQLNGTYAYPAPGRSANQLVTHSAIATISPAITQDVSTLPAYPDPFGSAPLADRARSYLHTNCSQCHRPSGGTPVNLDLRYTTALSATNACNVTPTAGDLGLTNARIISPGAAGSSVLAARMNTRGPNQMPTLGSNAVDTDGVTLITNWINGLANCN